MIVQLGFSAGQDCSGAEAVCLQAVRRRALAYKDAPQDTALRQITDAVYNSPACKCGGDRLPEAVRTRVRNQGVSYWNELQPLWQPREEVETPSAESRTTATSVVFTLPVPNSLAFSEQDSWHFGYAVAALKGKVRSAIEALYVAFRQVRGRPITKQQLDSTAGKQLRWLAENIWIGEIAFKDDGWRPPPPPRKPALPGQTVDEAEIQVDYPEFGGGAAPVDGSAPVSGCMVPWWALLGLTGLLGGVVYYDHRKKSKTGGTADLKKRKLGRDKK